jgi:hypothetical protein
MEIVIIFIDFFYIIFITVHPLKQNNEVKYLMMALWAEICYKKRWMYGVSIPPIVVMEYNEDINPPINQKQFKFDSRDIGSLLLTQ